MKVTEIDGIRVEVHRCTDCPFHNTHEEFKMGKVFGGCRHPVRSEVICNSKLVFVWRRGGSTDLCPLREV